ncbi:MAG TPA: CHASE2 domain-containing protein [Thermoleophilaceae bacterium]|jgi:CHASE2 domain-containing sensor protein
MDSRARLLPLIAAAALAVLVALAVQLTGALDSLERQSLGARFQVRGEQRPDEFVVVGIDDATFDDLGVSWPFRRSLHARAVDRLHEAGARTIVYDVQFTEGTKDSEDMALYEALDRAGGAVLATSESDSHGATNVLGGDENLRAIDSRAAGSDLTNDSTGAVERFPYSVSGLESVGVVAAERASGRPVDPELFEDGQARIDFRGGPGTVRTVSFSDLLRGRVDPAVLRGKIVVVGATAPTLRDVHNTPVHGDELMSGPEAQANAIWTALHGVPLHDAPPFLDYAAILLLGVLAPLARMRWRILAAAGAGIGAAAAYVVANQLAFESGTVLAVTAPITAALVGTGGMTVVSHLRETLERRRVARELRVSQLEVIHRLSAAVESRDEETGLHVERISWFAQRLALRSGSNAAEAELIGRASALHDVGKISIPDHVLLKPGKLDPAEWELMKSHTTAGAAILAGSSSPFVQMAETIARTHHERWDGSGYPAGLAGEEIPLAGRICGICDVFDALLSRRPYKDPWRLDRALAEIERLSGSHFDPRLVVDFLEIARELHGEWRYEPEEAISFDAPMDFVSWRAADAENSKLP